MTAYMPKAQREDWRTPPEVVELVRQVFDGEIGLDPCADGDPANWIAGGANLTEKDDGLGHSWGNTSVYVNPPYGPWPKWMTKCVVEAAHAAEIVLLIPARTDTIAWHQWVPSASAICLWKGRIKFVGAQNGAPFPASFIYWGPRIQRFREVFSPYGMVFRP